MEIRNGVASGDPNATSSPDRILSLAGKVPGKKAMSLTSTWVGTYRCFPEILRQNELIIASAADTRYKSIMVAHIATRKWLAGFFVE